MDALVLYIFSLILTATPSAIFSMIDLQPLSSLMHISLILFWREIRYQKHPGLTPPLNCSYRQHVACSFYLKRVLLISHIHLKWQELLNYPFY